MVIKEREECCDNTEDGCPYTDENGIWHQNLIDVKDSKIYTLCNYDGELVLYSC